MTVTTADLMLAIQAALVTPDAAGNYPTVAGARWFMPRDWPVAEEDIPLGKISAPSETKESLGKSGIKFTTTSHITLTGEVSCKGDPDAQSAGKILAALSLFQREIEMAVIGNEALFGGDQVGLVQQLARVSTRTATTSEGAMARGAVEMEFEFNFYQGEEDFQQLPMTAVERFHIYADLINVADPTGTYTPPAVFDYTPTPAPRTEGPDGRIEGEAGIDLPQ